MTEPYLLADDLTGALEAGASFRAAGWQVRIPLAESPLEESQPGVLRVYSTETRSASAPDAGAAVRRLLSERRREGARLLFKKIDSTLRGPVGAELSAVIEVLRPSLVVICPANPPAGRTVINGVVHVDGVTLADTDFRHDPAWPAETGDVRCRLAAQGAVVSGCLSATVVSGGVAPVRARIQEAMAGRLETCTLVCDAVTLFDIRTVVTAVLGHVPDAVFLGSGALGSVLADVFHPPVVSNGHPVPIEGSMLVLCGSRHPASHRQVAHLARDTGAAVEVALPTESLEEVVRRVVTGLDAGRPVAVKCDPGFAGGSPGAVSEYLGELAARLYEIRSPAVLYLTGGETANCVCRRLGGRTLEITRELEPGVVLSRLTRLNGGDVAVISKPGGYGTDDVLARNFREMDRSRDRWAASREQGGCETRTNPERTVPRGAGFDHCDG